MMGRKDFNIAPQIAPHLLTLRPMRPFCQHCAFFAYWPDLTSSQMVKLKHGVQIATKNERL